MVSLPTPAPANSASRADQGRALVKELRALSDQAGVRRSAKPKAEQPDSFALVLVASPFELAFFADHGDLLAPTAKQAGFQYAGVQLAFPELYVGLSLPKAKGYGKHKPTQSPREYFERWRALGDRAEKLPQELIRKAEVVRYTLDENGDGKLDESDRTGTESSTTGSTLDHSLIRHVYGVRLSEEGAAPVHETKVVARGVRAALSKSEGFDSQPKPLFSYTLSEAFAAFDLNGDGDESDELVFGDSDGDGKLGEAELSALYATAASTSSSLVDQLSVDTRFASRPGEPGTPSLLERVRKQYPRLDEDAAKRFVLGAVVRADLTLIVEYDDESRGARVRKHFSGAADFRNALMRIRRMTR